MSPFFLASIISTWNRVRLAWESLKCDFPVGYYILFFFIFTLPDSEVGKKWLTNKWEDRNWPLCKRWKSTSCIVHTSLSCSLHQWIFTYMCWGCFLGRWVPWVSLHLHFFNTLMSQLAQYSLSQSYLGLNWEHLVFPHWPAYPVTSLLHQPQMTLNWESRGEYPVPWSDCKCTNLSCKIAVVTNLW